MISVKEQVRRTSLSRFFLFAVLTAFVMTVASSRFLTVSGFQDASFWSDFYFYSYSFFYYSFFCFLLLFPAWLISLIPCERTAQTIGVSSIFVFVVLFVADTFVYQQFRLHLNLAMLQMTLLGGGQVVQFTPEMIVEIGLLVFLCLIAVLILWFASGWCIRRLTRFWRYVLGLMVVLGWLVVQGIYGLSYAAQDLEITRVNSLLPWNHPVRFNKLLVKTGLLNPKKMHSFSRSTSNMKMNYPLNSLDCVGTEHEYNILFVFVDSLRYDMLDPKIMPHAYEFSKRATVFREHFSGGINTRHGIFTLFTGIPGSYWEKSLETKSGSALIKALQARGYEIGIFAGAPLTMPEFNQTVFATVPNLRLESKGNSVIERDKAAIDDFTAWLKSLPKDKKFFSFIFLDNVHAQAFEGNPEDAPFQPYWKEVNQLKLSNSFDREPYFNRYKNSVHYADQQIGKILKSISEKIDVNKTIIVISADHGEEFNDTKLNYWGHNGNFTKYQAQVPFIVKWPGKEIPQISYRTSMLDVVPTILPEVLGCKNPIEEYSVGDNLFSPQKNRQWVYASNYSRNAFIERDRIILINEFGMLEYLDPNYRPTSNKTVPNYLRQVIEESTRFLK